jgi:hypothetical protein
MTNCTFFVSPGLSTTFSHPFNSVLFSASVVSTSVLLSAVFVVPSVVSSFACFVVSSFISALL